MSQKGLPLYIKRHCHSPIVAPEQHDLGQRVGAEVLQSAVDCSEELIGLLYGYFDLIIDMR
jgi:hypothetical protein